MAALTRLWEKLLGKPHRHEISGRVAAASDELINKTRELSDSIRPYTRAKDPLVALMVDLHNQRTWELDDRP